MKNKTLTYLALSLLCCICACTSVDLCPEAEHPHITDMRVRLNWGDISKDEIPADYIASPKEAAQMVYHVAEAPGYMTGQIVTFSGGWY